MRLEGGLLPMFAAIQASGEHDLIGLGFTAASARRALFQAEIVFGLE